MSCMPCPAGSVSPLEGGSACVECPEGEVAPDEGMLVCAACQPGTYTTDNMECVPCEPGTASNVVGASSCPDCLVGFETPYNGSLSCDICQPGTFAKRAGSPNCDICSPGHVSSKEGADHCEACPIGYEQPKRGAQECIICPAGSFSDAVGSDDCVQCPQGTWQDSAGSGSCRTCPDGKTTDNYGSTSVGACFWEQCPMGYKRVAGTKDCEECPHGTFSDDLESTQCTPCPMGQFNPIRRQRQCLACPSKHWTRSTGAIQPTDCIGPILTLCTEENMSGECKTYTDIDRNILGGPYKSLEVVAGVWNLCLFKNMWRNCVKVEAPLKIDSITKLTKVNFSPVSIESLIDDSFCYEAQGLEFQPSAFFNRTASGIGCKSWASTQHPEVGDNAYCANPAGEGRRTKPWCYTNDPEKEWEYCDIPKCVWDFACYTGTGRSYRGTVSRTEKGYVCQRWNTNWPHSHKYHHVDGCGAHNYARNPGNSEKAPWCYTTHLFKRWDYALPPKCNRADFPFYR